MARVYAASIAIWVVYTTYSVLWNAWGFNQFFNSSDVKTAKGFYAAQAVAIAVHLFGWALLMPLAWFFSQRVPLRREKLLLRLLAHAVMCVAFIFLYSLYHTGANAVRYSGPSRSQFWMLQWDMFFYQLQYSVSVYWAVAGVGSVAALQRALRKKERDAHALESRLSQNKLRTLQAQLQPHFLFNTLNLISTSLSRSGDARSRDVVVRLSTLLRTSLDYMDVGVVTLEEEISITKEYLEITRYRFSDTMEYAFDIANDTRRLAIPPFTLQPLIENVFTHMDRRSGRLAQIRVSARVKEAKLRVQIWSNAPVDTSSARPGFGIGQSNVRARLMELYGQSAVLSAVKPSSAGSLVTLSIPAVTCGSIFFALDRDGHLEDLWSRQHVQ